MSEDVYDFIIVGAGVAGLYAANQLSKQGFRILLLEQAPEVKEIGAGLSLWGIGLCAIREIGLLDTVLSKSTQWESYEQWRMHKKVTSHATRDLSIDQALPPVIMERSVLQFILLEALPENVELKCDYEVVSTIVENNICEVTSSKGDKHHAHYIIGADGIESCVRQSLVGPIPLKYHGYVCHRGICNNVIDMDESVGLEIYGKNGFRLGCFALPAGELYWFTFSNSKTEKVDFEVVRSHLATLHPAAAKLAEHIQPGDAMETPIFSSRPYHKKQGSNRSVLVGDSACTMQPSLGVGSSIALDDAYTLCRLIKNDPDNIDTAFSRFYDAQFPKWRKFSRINNFIGFLGQSSGRVGLCTMLFVSRIGFSSRML